MISILILTVLGFWIPCACAEISRDLDPMVSSELQATVKNESPTSAMAAGQTSNATSAVSTTKEKKKAEETKKKKVKKSSAKKASPKKSSKSGSEKAKTIKNSPN